MEKELELNKPIRHIAFIMDGNGRWAKAKGLPRHLGHKEACNRIVDIVEDCQDYDIEVVSLYAFSTENWKRPEAEVSALMGLVLANLEDEIFQKNNVRFRVIGDMNRLPKEVQQKLRETEEHTKDNTAMTMVVALSYSSRWEITQAVKNIIEEKKEQADFSTDDITEELLSKHMQTSFMPDPDLLIRTGGELRISNYLLWQIAYSELYFCDTYWPDFMEEDLHKAIADYQSRQRRFGKTEAQVEGAENKI